MIRGSAKIALVSFREILAAALRARSKGLVRDVPPGAEAPIPAGVLVPVFLDAGEPHLVFTRRTEEVRDHKGQISFPGGAREAEDPSILFTALREAQEEVGLDPAHVDVVGELDDYETVTNYRVTPFVGFIPHPYPYRPHPTEVAEVLEVPLAVLRDPARRSSKEILWKGEPRTVYYLDAGSCVVWGITARIVLQLLGALDRMSA